VRKRLSSYWEGTMALETVIMSIPAESKEEALRILRALVPYAPFWNLVGTGEQGRGRQVFLFETIPPNHFREAFDR
jgi:hypothetical protein